MEPDTWTAVDGYLCNLFVGEDPALQNTLRSTGNAGFPSHHVSPTQGKLLMLLAQMIRAKRILEIGTLGGYSAIWFARALPSEGHLLTLEIDPKRAELASANISRAGLSDRVEFLTGPALESLHQLERKGVPPFDLIFIDADKENNPGYFEHALKLAHPGTVIVVDNVVRGGAILDPLSPDNSVQGTRKVLDLLARDPRVTATALQTVEAKGYDGFALAIVN